VTGPSSVTGQVRAPAKKKKRGGSAARTQAGGASGARTQARAAEPTDERRDGRIAGVVALLSVACWLGALLAANAAGGASSQVEHGEGLGDPKPLSSARQLLDFHAGAGDQALATALRCLGLLLTAAFAVYLYRIVRTLRPTVPIRLTRIAVAGALLVCCSTVFGYFALHHVAAQFVGSGVRTSVRATRLLGSGGIKEAAVFDLISRAVLGGWIALTSREMMRAGLLDRFLGYWGYGAAVALVLLPIGDAMFVAWLGSIGIMALGYWPGGRPEAWLRLVKPA
jgi:hypothetical protein